MAQTLYQYFPLAKTMPSGRGLVLSGVLPWLACHVTVRVRVKARVRVGVRVRVVRVRVRVRVRVSVCDLVMTRLYLSCVVFSSLMLSCLVLFF